MGPPDALAADPDLRAMVAGNWLDNDALDAWCRRRGRENLGAGVDDRGAAAGGPVHPFRPGFLWDAGVARLIPFAVRGVLWYQGESNAQGDDRVRQHERLFPLLVADWRRQWGLGEFPFLYCQLSSVGTEKGYASHAWPAFRDGQRRMLATVPNVGMAVTSDLGHPTDVHPREKREVGRRLALWALAKAYGHNVAFSGPLPRAVRADGRALVVPFDHAVGGLRAAAGGAIRGFEVAGADGAFRPAVATVVGAELSVVADGVPSPTAVRYAWKPYADGNLTNGDALPASTFQLSLPSPK